MQKKNKKSVILGLNGWFERGHDASACLVIDNKIIAFAEEERFNVEGLIQSPITGPKGNVEFLIHLVIPFKRPFVIPELLDEWLGGD